MKNKIYIIKGLLFIFIIIIPVFFIDGVLANLPSSYKIKKNCLETNASKIQVIVTGSSHANNGIATSSLSMPSCNLANSSQSIYYDYQLILKYIDKLPNLKLIVIPLSYFSLETDLDQGQEDFRKYFYQKYFGIKDSINSEFNIKQYSFLAAYTPKEVRNYLLFIIPKLKHTDKTGWFPLGKNNSGINIAVEGKYRAEFHTTIMDPRFIDKNKKYLDEMVKTATSKNIKVVLITTPTTKKYWENIDKNKYQTLINYIEDISRKYNITYYDYFKDSRFTTENFADYSDHLDSDNAIKFTKIMQKDFIDNAMKK